MPATTYLDHAASTPMRPEAVEAMLPFLTEAYGNPSGAHRMARDARRAIDDARDTMAELLGCEPGEVVFTSGGTEADNLAVLGVHDAVGGTVVCSTTEHHAVLDPVERLGGRLAGVDPTGVVDIEQLAERLDESVELVSVHLVNNEIGVIQPLGGVAAVVHDRAPAAAIHTDAVQALCWLDVGRAAAEADLISVSAHKFGGPKGVGALVVRKGTRLSPRVFGGGQEREWRSGTQNVAGIVAMAVAARLAADERKAEVDRIAALRDRLIDTVLAAVPGAVETAVVDGDRSHKVAGNGHVCIDGIESEALLFLLESDGVYASAASSCSSGAQEPSHVLAALGVARSTALGSLRLSLGHATTDDEIDRAIDVIPRAVDRLRLFGS
jgi:cysteine desulfurase